MSKPARKKVQSPFAKNLKAILAERGLSQKAAAEVANVTPATLNDWLAGSNPSDHLAVQRLCRAIGCSFEWFDLPPRVSPPHIGLNLIKQLVFPLV